MNNIENRRDLQAELSIAELDRELIRRGTRIAGPGPFEFADEEGTPEREALMANLLKLYESAQAAPANESLRHIGTEELVTLLKYKTWEINQDKGIWGEDGRIDQYEIVDERIKNNSHSVAVICREKNLIAEEKGFFALQYKNYGKAFNLCANEPFGHQPIAAGRQCTGFLVKEDVIATAGHCACEKNVTDLRIVFGFKMTDDSTPVTRIAAENIYGAIEVIDRFYIPGQGADWALVKLDRSVTGPFIPALSKKEICLNQPLYILGHPCGLPLKYSGDAKVCYIEDGYFSADLNVYSGNSGSPVFDKKTHEVVGIVVRGDSRDFRWTGKGWMSVIYPNPEVLSREPQCTRVSQFIDLCR
jgi:hypothetical protein